MRRLVVDFADRRPIYRIPGTVVERLRAALPADWEVRVVDAPADGSADGGTTASREALEADGARPAILNAANEVAVAAFLARSIGFLEIAAIVADTLDRYAPAAPDSLDAVLAIDAEARAIAGERVKDCVA